MFSSSSSWFSFIDSLQACFRITWFRAITQRAVETTYQHSFMIIVFFPRFSQDEICNNLERLGARDTRETSVQRERKEKGSPSVQSPSRKPYERETVCLRETETRRHRRDSSCRCIGRKAPWRQLAKGSRKDTQILLRNGRRLARGKNRVTD